VSFFAKIGRERRLVTQEWTPERAAALITWWNEGICASEIGRRLSVTKNAVIGKAFRLQLPKRRPSSPTQSDDQSVIRLERLGAGMCSWPLGATDRSGYHFCGSAAVPAKPYCPTHCKLAYLPAAKNRKAAAVA
jgi:GcrA cell cycle regulator